MTSSFAILPLLLLLLLLLIVAGLILGIILWARGGRARSDGQMACGGCGYAVRGLEALNCPECGVDLREAGISRGTSPHQRTAGIVLTVFCGGLLLTCLGSSAFIFLAAPSSSSSPASSGPSSTTSPPAPITPAAPPLAPLPGADTEGVTDADEPSSNADVDGETPAEALD